MYTHTLPLQIAGAKNAITQPVERYGVMVYVDTDPDSIGCDFRIEPGDVEGLKIFKEFAVKMATHYITLKNKS